MNPVTSMPPYATGKPVVTRLLLEAWDHLWPWSRRGFQRQRALQAVSMGAAVAVNVVWLLAVLGQVHAGAVIGWWTGWSVFEVLVRLHSKPYVKEGPWWGTEYRVANTMDMICYVAFKNLLIGAALFLALKSAGLLAV